MLTIEKKQTLADFKKIEEGNYCQLINGEIIMSPSPTSKHHDVSWSIVTQLGIFLEKTHSGKA